MKRPYSSPYAGRPSTNLHNFLAKSLSYLLTFGRRGEGPPSHPRDRVQGGLCSSCTRVLTATTSWPRFYGYVTLGYWFVPMATPISNAFQSAMDPNTARSGLCLCVGAL